MQQLMVNQYHIHHALIKMQCDKSKSMFRYNKTIKNTIQKLIALYNRKVKYIPTLVYTRTHDFINYLRQHVECDKLRID